MYQSDWIMRQIELLALGIAKIFFSTGVSITELYKITDKANLTETDILYNRLTELLIDLKINEAENLLFENIDTEDRNYLLVAIDFYMRLNELDDKTLEKNNFSRDEIYSGLNEIKEMYDIAFL